MRVLHVTDTYGPTVGGIEVLVESLSGRQAAAGHDVTVLTATQSPTTRQAPGAVAMPATTVRDHGRVPSRHDPASVVVVREPSELARLVNAADCVHAHVSAFSPLALRAAEVAARQGVPVVATVHSMWGAGWPVVRAVGMVRSWTSLPIQWAAVSEAAAGSVRRALGARPVMVLPNAIDTALWAPSGPPDVRPGGRPDVTIVGVQRMARRKRPLPLLATLQHVRALVPDHIRIRAVLIGDGPQLGALRRRVAAAGMASWVEAPGARSHTQLRDLYRVSDIFVAPATLESFGIAALEARASGLAVAGRTSTGVADFVGHGVDGTLATDDLEMAAQLAELCSDRGSLDTIRAHNHAIRPAFDWADTLWRTDYAYVAAAELCSAATTSAIGLGSVGVAR